MLGATRPVAALEARPARRLPVRLMLATLGVGIIATTLMIGSGATGALFTDATGVETEIGAGQIFDGDRGTTAFEVTDASSGTGVNASNQIAFAGDGRMLTTSAWPAAFAADRYAEFRMNDPLPLGLANVSAAFDLRWAGAAPATAACAYLEVRNGPNGAVLETAGSAGSPLECTSGTSFVTTHVSLTSLISTDLAGGVAIRVYIRDDVGSGVVIDSATVSGDYGLDSYALYPVELVDAADSSAQTFRWGLAGP